MPGPIAERAARRITTPLGATLNDRLETVPRPIDGTDVRGMLQPLLDAIGELEDLVISLRTS